MEKRNSGNNKPSQHASWESLRLHLHAELDIRRADLILLYCYIITGLLDSSAVFIWGAFVSMQTGNTVYLGLGLGGSHNGDDRWIKSGVSIASFCIGSAFFGTFHRVLTCKNVSEFAARL